MGYDEIWRYDQLAGGTHPTGMHSCLETKFTDHGRATSVKTLTGNIKTEKSWCHNNVECIVATDDVNLSVADSFT